MASASLGDLGQLLVQLGQALGRGRVGLLGQRHLLDLELAHAAGDDVELGRHRVDLDAQAAGRLVDEVDGLVGEEAAGHVAVREHGRRDERRVLDAHAVVDLVALLQPPQDGDRVDHRGLAHEDLREAPLEGGVLLDVAAVLVEGRGADEAQLAAGEQRLDHVAGVHRPLGRAGAHDRVQLVDEGDHVALGVGDLLQDRLEPLFELAPVLGPGQHRPEVERDHPLALQALGDVALHDAVGQALDDGRLADAGLADQDRVVLRPARQHLDHAADLLVAPDDRVELAGPGQVGQVPAVALEGLGGLLGVGGRHPVAAADVAQRRQQLLLGGPELAGEGEQQVLDRQELVGQLGPGLVGRQEALAGHPGERRLRAAEHLGQPRQRLFEVARALGRLHTHLGQQRPRDVAGLGQHRGEEVGGRDLGVLVGDGQLGGVGERLLGLLGPAFGVERHVGQRARRAVR